MSSIRRILDEIHNRSLWQVLGLYLAGGWLVLQVVDQLVQQLILPDWLYRGTLWLLLAGLPVLLCTAFVQKGIRSTRGAEPRGLGRWLTWRRALAIVLGGLALLGVGTAGYVVSRALGIGPGATLISRGVLEERQPILIADFANHTGDSLLGDAVAQALRIDLLQSPAVTVVEPARVAQALRLMEREPTSSLDLDVALDMAVREGFGAVLAGEVTPVGSGLVLSAELVSARSGESLVGVRETAENLDGVIPALSRLSRGLRERIGESLASLRTGEPLERVSTSSLEALRRYSAGVRAAELEGDWVRAAELYEQAVALDSTFAMAHRKLGVAARVPAPRRIQALTQAYRHRQRLVERERLLIEGSYHSNVTGDREEAIRAYRALLAVHPDDGIALNNLALLLRRTGDLAGAVSLLRRALQTDPSAVPYQNLGLYLWDLGREDEARAAIDEWIARFPENMVARAWRVGGATAERDYALADSLADAFLMDFPEHPNAKIGGLRFQVWTDAVRGRLEEAEEHLRDFVALAIRFGHWSLAYQDAIQLADASTWSRGDPARAVREVEALLARHPIEDRDPLERPYLGLATVFARAGQPARSRALLSRLEAEVPPELRGDAGSAVALARGILAVSEGDLPAAVALLREAEADQREWCLLCPLSELAIAYDRAGQADSAIALYERYLDTRWAMRIFEDPIKLPYTLERLARLHDARGDLRAAARYYAEFVELWSGADEELQGRVRSAQARLEEILAALG